MTTITKKTAKKSIAKKATVKVSAKMKSLQAQVAKAQKENADKLAEKVMEASLTATLALESSEELFEAKVKLAVISQNTKKLQSLVDVCSGIIDENPVQNTKTRAVREWAGTRRFDYGTQINLIHQLVTGVMYSVNEHKPLLLAHTGLDIELIEQVAAAFGSTAYYARKTNMYTEAKPYDVEEVLSTIAVLQSVLGIVVDTSLITAANFSLEFGNGEVRALKEQKLANKAISDMENDL